MKISVGVEIGAKFIQAAVVDKYGRLLARAKMPSSIGRGLKELVADAASLVNKLLDEQGFDLKNIKSIGVASPGVPDEDGTKILKAFIMGFYDAPIKDEFEKYFDVPVYVDNDAHCAALAESVAGAAEDLEYSMTINIGTGISGGIIINNRIYGGYSNAGAVIGHMVIDKHGKECYCGRKGCFETVCSATALIEATREVALKNPESKVLEVCRNDLSLIDVTTAYEAMLLGDEDAKEIFDEYIDNFAVALTNLANILMPEVIVICGGIADLGEALLKPIREKLYAWLYSKEIALPLLKFSEMGSASVLVGAAMLGAYKRM